jgi:hypothetical protein
MGCSKLEHLPLSFNSTLVYYLKAEPEPYQVELLMGVLSKGRLLALHANIRPGWKWLIITDTPAYYDYL